MKQLQGRTALLTGAAGGIGPHIARALAAEGVNLVVSGLETEREKLEQLCASLRELDVAAAGVTADLTDLGQLDSLWERAGVPLGSVEILVNNAGVGVTAEYASFTQRELEWIVAVNLTAPMVLTRHAVAAMQERDEGGHVVFMASLAGRMGTPYNEPYAATKAGLLGLSQSLRAEYADSPIGFSTICPGFVAGAGMYSRMDRGRSRRLPVLTRGTGPEAVGRAVVRAIRRDKPEIVVNPTPMRPLLALYAVAPKLAERFVRWVGTDEVFRRMARARRRGREVERVA